MKIWRIKKGLVTLLLISVLMMTLKSSLEPSNFEESSDAIDKYFAEIDLANDKPSGSREVRDVFSYKKPADKETTEKTTISRCGYDVSLYKFFLALAY